MALTKAEREIVLTLADDEKEWHIYTDSRRFGSRLRKIAAAWGVTAERLGSGTLYRLPIRAVRFGGPRVPRPDAKSRPNGSLFRGRFGRPVQGNADEV